MIQTRKRVKFQKMNTCFSKEMNSLDSKVNQKPTSTVQHKKRKLSPKINSNMTSICKTMTLRVL